MLSAFAVKTPVFSVGGDLAAFIAEAVDKAHVHDHMLLAVTSKIVSLAEHRLVDRETVSKKALVKKEADVFLGPIGHGFLLTIKHGQLIASAGIDESNSPTGGYILYPENPFASAARLRARLKQIWNIENLGVIFTDSHTSPLKRGVTGTCLAYAGFKALRDLVGTPDLFGRELKMTQVNLAEALAVTAVMLMGEGSESTPLALINGAEVEFAEEIDDYSIPLREDLYAPILRELDAN